jgi:predicted acetyltransferase
VIEVRVADDVRAFLRPVSVGFGDEPTDDWPERFEKLMPRDRMLSAYEDGLTVGSAGSFAFELTVPGGGFVPAAGVTVVGVLPTHRRRGILTQLMRVQLDDVRRRGEPVAYLWASEERIYGRFGFGLASLGLSLDLPTARAAFRDDPGRSGGVQLLDEEQAYTAIPPIYERARAGNAGFFSRSEPWWTTRRLRRQPWSTNDLFRAIWDEDAYALYTFEMDFGSGRPSGTVEVLECVATSLDSTREIWRYLLSIDLVERVGARRLPLDHELVLLVEEPRRLDLRVADGVWVRLVDVDVGAALAARALGEGTVVLDVADAFLPENAGRWRVSAGGVGRTDDSPDLALDVADLGSLYLGGFTVAELERSGRAHELVPGAVARADALLRRPRRPWCPEIF